MKIPVETAADGSASGAAEPRPGSPQGAGDRGAAVGGWRRWRRQIVRFCLLLGLLVGAATWFAQGHVASAAAPFVRGVHDAPVCDCILVPGARIHPDGTPYHLLEDRLAVALELFRHGRAPRVVVSGLGGGGLAVDEVAAMRRWLEARGVPAAAILDDPDGLRTIASMRACRQRFGMRSVLVASNPFHVARCVYLARHFGLDAYGVPAPALVDYSAAVLWKNRGREVLARVLACWDCW